MAKKVKLVVNDFHLGKGPVLKDGTVNILEDFRYGAKFVEFLEHYSSGEFEDADVELIINGDFLNLLQIDYLGIHTYLVTERMVVHGVRSIIAGHPKVFDALRKFAASPNHEIAYIIGNHDVGLLFDGARKTLRECVGEKLRFYDTYYEFDHVRVEHGHAYEAINATDPQKFKLTDPDYPEPVFAKNQKRSSLCG
jgi:UDP-2,3-diacylglucosamine pyrophosphatase LpxH